MSSRDDRQRQERSWERDVRERPRDRGGGRDRDRDRDRDRGRRGDYATRRSRSRSPVRRGGERDRDRRDHGRDRRDDRRDRERYRGERDRDRFEEHRDHDRTKDDKESRRERADELKPLPPRDREERERLPPPRSGPSQIVANGPVPRRINLDPDYDDREEGEERDEGEPMDAETEEEAALRAMLGFGGFGSTKGKPVLGNEEGAVEIKKQRTWRQYMNRRGGFNRPLDKIK
ncbi:hypothetical protein ACEPAH_4377 [Sanghuangporus vaninii]